MKRVITIASLAALSTAASAFDYKINLEGRADFVNGKVETSIKDAASTTEKFNNFSNGLIRLNMLGNINDNLSYRFRYRFISSAANPTGATTTREVSSQAVDYLYVDHKNEYFTTRFGKQNWVDAAGRESYASGTDVFLASGVATNYKAAFGSDYRFGVSFIGKIAETNIVTLAFSNPNATMTDTAGAEEKNTGLAMGAYYNGQFFEKAFQPTLGYTTAKQNGDTDVTPATAQTKDADYSIWNAGFRSEFAGFTLDADYKVLEKENRNGGTNTTAANLKEETKSVYAMLSYAAGQFTPIAYYINDQFEREAVTGVANVNYDRSAFAVGTYWKPMADVNFRYHIMYSHDVKEFDAPATTTTSKVEDDRFWLGFKIDV